jgi:hypothetical protein
MRKSSKKKSLTWPVSVSNLYNRIAGLFDCPMFDFLGVIDGAIIIQLTGFPICIKEKEKELKRHEKPQTTKL